MKGHLAKSMAGRLGAWPRAKIVNYAPKLTD
jgi:hypothetical protein